MQNLLTSKATWAGILAAVVNFGNMLVPVLPPVWANLITAILGVYALYAHTQVVAAARVAGAVLPSGKKV